MKEHTTTSVPRRTIVGIGILATAVLVGSFFLVKTSLEKKGADGQEGADASAKVEAQSPLGQSSSAVILPEGRLSDDAMKKVFPNADQVIDGVEKSQDEPKPVAHVLASMTYVVVEGDWLSKICPSDWKAVATLNGIADPNLIYPGQKLELTEQCGEAPVVAQRRESVKAPRTIAAKEVSPQKTEAPAPIREEKASDKSSTDVALPSVSTASGETSRLSYCEWNTLPFKWQQPGINPVGVDDPKEYLDCLAESEGLPTEALKYFVDELRKGDQGDYIQVDLRDGESLGAMVGKKVNGKIRVHRNTILTWSVQFYKENSPISNGVRRKQTVEEKRLNGTARKYVFVVGSTKWVLLRAYICGNLILRREEVIPPPAAVVVPPEPEQKIEIATLPKPIPTPPPTVGTYAPQSRPQDCAMPGCVLSSLSDASPARANSCESAPTNSDPFGNAKGVHPVVDGTCSLADARPDDRPRYTTFTVLGSAFINETDPEKICRMTPDVEYRGMQLICLADGTVMRGE